MRDFGARLRVALVVGGITAGILFLVFLQVALPYWIGPAGLAVVGVADAAIVLAVRHRRVARGRARGNPAIVRGPATHRGGPMKDEFVVTVALLFIVLGFTIVGLTLQALEAHANPTLNFVLFQVGVVALVIGDILLWPYEWRFYDRRTESEKYDTTEDH